MERELLLTGIGGQGIQLAAELLARAAVTRGRHVLLFGSYGGMMRGGNTDATLIVGDAVVESPPTVSTAWSAIVMHHAYAAPLMSRLQPDGLLLVNTTVLTESIDHPGALPIAAGDVAVDLGNSAVACMVMVGAYAAATGLVDLDALVAELPASLPPYRQKHIAVNEQALAAGHALVPAVLAPAWEVVAV